MSASTDTETIERINADMRRGALAFQSVGASLEQAAKALRRFGEAAKLVPFESPVRSRWWRLNPRRRK